MPVKLGTIITRLFQTRDELSLRNLRGRMWPMFLIFPLTIIMGDLRYFDLKFAVAGFESYEFMLFPLGLGWLVLVWTPKRLIIPFLRAAAVISAVLLPFQIFTPNGIGRLGLFMAFQFFNGLCAACAFSLFCFELNNIERLFGMALAQLYFGFYYTVWRAFPAVQAAGKTWGSGVVMGVYLVVVLACTRTFGSRTKGSLRNHEKFDDTDGDGKDSAVPFIIGLNVAYFITMCLINYIEWVESSMSSMAFGLGAFVSVVLIIIIQLLKGRSALYIWFLFLALSLLGMGMLLYDSPVTLVSGSFTYGLGDGLGYIIIYYISAAAINRSKSFRMLRLFFFVFFVEYFIISGIFTMLFKYIEAPNKVLAFGVVLVLGSFCLMLMPLLQKKLFNADWTDGLCLRDMEGYSGSLSKVEAIDTKDRLNLTSREQEIFSMLLAGTAPKEIAYTLKVSYDTIRFHQKNLYRKLGIQSRAELFARYLSVPDELNDPRLSEKP